MTNPTLPTERSTVDSGFRRQAARLWRAIGLSGARRGAANVPRDSDGVPSPHLAMLEDAMQSLGDGIALYGPDDRLVWCNERFLKLRSINPLSGQVGAHFADILRSAVTCGEVEPPPEDVEAWVQARLEERRHSLGSKIQFRNGRWLRVTDRRMGDGSIVSIHSDITELKAAEAAAEAALKRNEHQTELLSTLIENLHVGVSLVDADGRFMALNHAYRELYDLPAELCTVGATFESHMRYLIERGDFTDRGEAEATIRQIVERAMRPEPQRLERMRRNGRITEIRRAPLPRGGFVNTYIDVTEARRREVDLTEARARLERQTEVLSTLTENLQAGVTLVDANGRFMALNQAYLALYDIPRGTFRPGDSFESCIRYMVEHGDFADGGDVEATVRRIVDRAMRPEPQQLERTRANGRVVEIRRVPLPSGGFVTTYFDVTEARRREVDLTEARARLERQANELAATAHKLQTANAAKSTFLANMSHELRTPLNAILGFAEVMRDAMLGPLDSRYRDYAKDIHVSGAYLLRLINDILDTSKIDAGQMRLEKEPIDLIELLAECERLVLERARSAGVALAGEIAPHFPPIAGDRLRLKQALLNLLVNAIKFTPSGGEIRFSAAASPRDGIEIAIADTGIGMEPKHIARALEPFQQLDNHLARRYEGTGLGLPLAKALIELHGGRLTLDSAPGRGTTARIWLPPEHLLDGRAPATAPRLRSHR